MAICQLKPWLDAERIYQYIIQVIWMNDSEPSRICQSSSTSISWAGSFGRQEKAVDHLNLPCKQFMSRGIFASVIVDELTHPSLGEVHSENV